MAIKNKDRSSFSLEEAKDFTSRFCRPEDDEVVSHIDESAREAAWRLLKELEVYETQVVAADDASAIEEPTSEIEEVNKEVEEILEAVPVENAGEFGKTKLIDHIKDKALALGLAGLISVASGMYFQAGVVKEEGIEIAITAEKEFKAFSNLNDWLNNTFGISLSMFDGIIASTNQSGESSTSNASTVSTNTNNDSSSETNSETSSETSSETTSETSAETGSETSAETGGETTSDDSGANGDDATSSSQNSDSKNQSSKNNFSSPNNSKRGVAGTIGPRPPNSLNFLHSNSSNMFPIINPQPTTNVNPPSMIENVFPKNP